MIETHGSRTKGVSMVTTDDVSYYYERAHELLHDVAPALQDAQNAWMSQIESLRHLDPKTSELIRLAYAVATRSPHSVGLHAMRAAEVGATWNAVASAILLTEPAFGLLCAFEALPAAREGFERGLERLEEDEASA
jgi:AhpD family alkylhydroperoxidase